MRKYIILFFFGIGIVLSCCGVEHYRNSKPDDILSNAIYSNVGAEEIYYRGKDVSANNVTCYSYLIYVENEGQLQEFINAANNALLEMKTMEKIAIRFDVVYYSGTASVFTLNNFSDVTKNVADYQTFQRCNIWGVDDKETIYNMPSTYYNLPDIKVLIIEGKMAKITQEQNIDWAAHYPDLDKLEVILDEDSH